MLTRKYNIKLFGDNQSVEGKVTVYASALYMKSNTYMLIRMYKPTFNFPSDAKFFTLVHVQENMLQRNEHSYAA